MRVWPVPEPVAGHAPRYLAGRYRSAGEMLVRFGPAPLTTTLTLTEAMAMSSGEDKSTSKVKVCVVCGTPLIEPGGCAGTGMCGPCCTGDASTAGEY